MSKVTLTRLEHRERPIISIGFDYNDGLRLKVKSIAGVRWSRRLKSFYVFEEDVPLKELFWALRQHGIYIDYSALVPPRPTRMPEPQKRRPVPREVPALVRERMKPLRRYMEGLRLSKSTIATYSVFMEDFLTFCEQRQVCTLTATDARLFIEEQVAQKRYGISSHRQLVSALKHLGSFYELDALRELDDLRPKKSSYLPTVLSQQEMVRLLQHTRNLKHRAALALLYSSGLRIGELIGLQLRDIDVDRRQIFIKNGKGRKDRVVILAESFVPLFRNYFVSYRPKLFFMEHPDGGPYTAGSVRSFLRKACRRAGISKRVTPHTLRHSYATHLIEAGVGLRHVQELLGHAKPETTMIYTHVAKKDLLAIQSPLDRALQAIPLPDNNAPKLPFTDSLGG
jgi:site-specific recombinase XerD